MSESQLFVARVSWQSAIWLACIIAWMSNAGTAATANVGDLEVDFGIDGHFRVGRWTQLTLREAEADTQYFSLQALDGEAVRYTSKIERSSNGDFRVYIPAGPEGSQLEIRSGEGQSESSILYKRRLIQGLVPIDRPWIVGIGSAAGLDRIGSNELLDIAGTLAVSVIRKPAEAPDIRIGFDGVDYVVLSSSSIDILKQMTPKQHQALREWVEGGGEILVSLGSRGPELVESVGWLRKLLGEDLLEVVTVEPESIEAFVSAKSRTEAYSATRFSAGTGAVVLAGRTTSRQTMPLVTVHAFGLGRATFFAGGLDEKPLEEWKQFDDFVERIVPRLVADTQSRMTGPTAEIRYTELAGQLRVNLDHFASSRGAQFSLLAAIVLAVIGFVGPIDYFLVNRWMGRPMLGWLSFPLAIVGFSGAIIFYNKSQAELGVRQVSVVDIDPASGVGRGVAYAQLYSDDASRYDVEMSTTGPYAASDHTALISPWGYAGRVFGGIEVTGEDIRLPSYTFETSLPAQLASRNDTAPASDDVPANLSSRLLSVPLAPRSSRGLVGRWRFPANYEISSNLQRRVGSDLLVGSFINPLPVDLLDGYLVYRNLVYLLPTRVPAGSRVSAIESLVTKNFRWRLNRRQTVEESSRSEPWNPASDENLERLMEIVLFYDAAGGAKYAGLENRELGDLDLSDILALDQAMLIGRLADSPAQISINGQTVLDGQVQQLSYLRIILPVSGRASGNSSPKGQTPFE